MCWSCCWAPVPPGRVRGAGAAPVGAGDTTGSGACARLLSGHLRAPTNATACALPVGRQIGNKAPPAGWSGGRSTGSSHPRASQLVQGQRGRVNCCRAPRSSQACWKAAETRWLRALPVRTRRMRGAGMGRAGRAVQRPPRVPVQGPGRDRARGAGRPLRPARRPRPHCGGHLAAASDTPRTSPAASAAQLDRERGGLVGDRVGFSLGEWSSNKVWCQVDPGKTDFAVGSVGAT